MKSAVLRNAQDSYVESKNNTKNYNTVAQMYLQDGAYGYVFFANPVPPRAKVLSATLKFWNGHTWNGTVGMNIAKVTKSWSASSVTWKTQPTAAGPVKTLSKINAPTGTEWSFDVTDYLQAASDGAPWYGFRVDITGTTRRWIHSTNSSSTALRPYLEVVWSEDPFPPSTLSPHDDGIVSVAKPVLRWDFYDVAGDKTMAGYQVQVNQTSDFSAPQFDTGEVAASVPSLDLATTSYAGLALGGRAWWRVRVRDAANLWSGWSTPESFLRQAKPTVALTSPTDSGILEESSPPVSWNYSGVQTQYQVLIQDLATQATVWDSKIVTSTENSVTPPAGTVSVRGRQYRTTVRCWDGKDREATPGDPVWSEASKVATYDPSSSTTGVQDLTVNQRPQFPGVLLEWSSANQPDGFSIIRDGVVLVKIDNAEDLLVPGSSTRYRWADLKVPARYPHTWEVARVVNGYESPANNEVTYTVRLQAPTLVFKDGTGMVALANPEVDPGLSEEADVLYPQDGPPMLVTSSVYGYVGTASGLLADEFAPGLTARQQRDNYLRMRRAKGVSVYFMWSDEAVECLIYNTKISQVSRTDGTTEYEVSFGFVQVDA